MSDTATIPAEMLDSGHVDSGQYPWAVVVEIWNQLNPDDPLIEKTARSIGSLALRKLRLLCRGVPPQRICNQKAVERIERELGLR